MNNLQLLRETHLMDREYFKVILTLVKASSEICYHKIRRTGLHMLCPTQCSTQACCILLCKAGSVPTPKSLVVCC